MTEPARHPATADAWAWLAAEDMEDARRARIASILEDIDAEFLAWDAALAARAPAPETRWSPAADMAWGLSSG